MATFSKITLSQSTDGAGIFLTATAAPGVLTHVTQSSTADYDEVWLYANNISAADVTVNVYWGNTGSTNYLGPINVQAYAGPVLVSPGLILRGTGSTGSPVYSTASATGAVNLFGYVNRITA
jgi:hypothetical protein